MIQNSKPGSSATRSATTQFVHYHPSSSPPFTHFTHPHFSNRLSPNRTRPNPFYFCDERRPVARKIPDAKMNISLILTFALLSLFSISTHAKHNNLNSRGTPANNNPNNEQKNGISKPCQTYYSANTPHAVCNGDRSMMCLAGCTGGVVVQNCQSNSSSPLTTETCSVAFSQTSEAAYLCNTPQGAYTCQGPQTGGVVCHNCVSTPNGVLPSNKSSSTANTPGHSSSNSTNEHDQQGSSSDSSAIILTSAGALSGLFSLLITASLATLL